LTAPASCIEAAKIQSQVRQQFSAHLANGRAVGFEVNEEQGTYLLEPYED
jgi:hypothetical protein